MAACESCGLDCGVQGREDIGRGPRLCVVFPRLFRMYEESGVRRM